MSRRRTRRGTLTLATNNGDIAGGEVMLFAIAEAARELGCAVTIVAPTTPGDVLRAAQGRGFRVIGIKANSRARYIRGLRSWDSQERQGLLWCNGLVPAFATSGHPNRVVHLHQAPRSGAQRLAAALACLNSRQLYVPSLAMTVPVKGSTALANWTDPVALDPSAGARPDRPVRLGFIGRHSPDKGLVVLADALKLLDQRRPGDFRLVLAGDPRSVPVPDAERVASALMAVSHLVDYRGWVPRREFFASIDVAVFPSVWAEPFGLVVAEAQSARVPFIITDAGALPEVAGPGYPWVARAGDPAALARTIESALEEADPRTLEQSYRRWEQEYSPEAGKRRLAEQLVRLGVLSHSP